MRRLSCVRLGAGVYSQDGFSFIEVLVALTVTVIILGVLFGLLAQGSGASTEEFERTDLQAQARAALQLISDDVRMAGGNLPPEFPAIRPRQTPGVRDTNTTGLELVGDIDDAGGTGALPVVSFDGRTVRLGAESPRMRRGELVLVYDDEPTEGKWMFGLVEQVLAGTSEILLVTEPGASVPDANPPISLPLTIDSYNRPMPESGFITPITVIGYGLDDYDDKSDLARSSLWRQVNWGDRVDVAYIENLDIRYFVGGTVVEPVAPAPGTTPRVIFGQGTGHGHIQSTPAAKQLGPEGEVETTTPPEPQPIPSRPIEDGALIRGVRISVTSRSTMANLRGSTLREGQELTEEGYLRETLTTRVAPRNLLIQADRRRQELELQAARDASRNVAGPGRNPNSRNSRRPPFP